MASLERARGARSSINFGLHARAFDDSAVPPQALEAKRAVIAGKRPDALGVTGRRGWDSSVDAGCKFPDKPLMRQLAQYDSLKRADVNFRAETLDFNSTAAYVPKASKFQYNERHILHGSDRLTAPPTLSRTEFPTNAALDSKPRFDLATGAAGDPYAAQKARERQEQQQLEKAQGNSRRHPPQRRIGLIEREQKHLADVRAQKAARRAYEAGGGTWQPPPPPLSERDAYEMSRQVPTLKTTTWSFGSI